jgi:hypothetical protein
MSPLEADAQISAERIAATSPPWNEAVIVERRELRFLGSSALSSIVAITQGHH